MALNVAAGTENSFLDVEQLEVTHACHLFVIKKGYFGTCNSYGVEQIIVYELRKFLDLVLSFASVRLPENESCPSVLSIK